MGNAMNNTHVHAESEPHSDAFLSADDLRNYMREMRLARSEGEWAKLDKEAQAKKRFIEALKQPIEVTEEKIRMVVSRMKLMAADGKSELMIMRFPSELCTDRGRKVNQAEPGWEDTLIGVPRQVFECWRDRLKPLGYRMTATILDFPGGRPWGIETKRPSRVKCVRNRQMHWQSTSLMTTSGRRTWGLGVSCRTFRTVWQ